MQVTFHGATETVTGSRHLVEANGRRVLVDCGLFQGVKRLRTMNWEPFPVDPTTIDAVVLTHAHIDHSGFLPGLVRGGFGGPIYCTSSSASLASILLPDSAHLQEEEARYANKRRSSKHDPALPLFTQADAELALDRFRIVEFDTDFSPVDGISARFGRAGHILGAAWVRIDDGDRSVLFSGDLGRDDDLLMMPPTPPPDADHVVIESTYGDRAHPASDPIGEMERIVNDTIDRRGIVLIPVFAVGRAQTILHILATLRAQGRIPSVPTYLNSPMAIDATEMFIAARGDHLLTDAQVEAMCDGVEFVRDVEASKELTARRDPMIVLSASGMITGGRVLHHVNQVGPDRRNTIVLAGYQATGTRGATLAGGGRILRIYGDDVPIRAQVEQIDSLSAHADADGLLRWLGSMATPPSAVSVVHGEAGAADVMRRRIGHELDLPASVPGMGDSVVVASARPRATD